MTQREAVYQACRELGACSPTKILKTRASELYGREIRRQDVSEYKGLFLARVSAGEEACESNPNCQQECRPVKHSMTQAEAVRLAMDALGTDALAGEIVAKAREFYDGEAVSFNTVYNERSHRRRAQATPRPEPQASAAQATRAAPDNRPEPRLPSPLPTMEEIADGCRRGRLATFFEHPFANGLLRLFLEDGMTPEQIQKEWWAWVTRRVMI